MYMCILPACMPEYHMCACYTWRLRALDPLELELQMVVNCHVDARD